MADRIRGGSIMSRRKFWCRLGLHRWYIAVDYSKTDIPTLVAHCPECGKVEVEQPVLEVPKCLKGIINHFSTCYRVKIYLPTLQNICAVKVL